MTDMDPVLSLRERTEQHARRFFREAQKPDIKAFLPLKAQTEEEAAEDYRKTKLPGAASFGKTVYLGEKYVGDVWCYGIDPQDDPQAMLSYCIFDSAARNRGVATCAVGLFLNEIAAAFGVKRIGAFTYLANAASVRVLEKNGFAMAEQPDEQSGYFVRDIHLQEGN